MSRPELEKRILAILSPLIGSNMADAALDVQCKKLGITRDRITSNEVPSIAKGMEKGLVIFVGSKKAREISSMIERSAA